MGTLYDLYSAVYHVGALGGGHYITTVRDMSDHLARVLSSHNLNSNDQSTPPPPPSPSPLPTAGGGGPSPVKWWCYNDSTVTPITSDKDIVVSSAYVLFYIRKDLQSSRFQDIHQVPAAIKSLRQQHPDHTSPANSPSDNEQEEKPTRMAEAKNKLSRLIPPNMTVARGGEESGDSTQVPVDSQDNCSVS
jgi:hypothetical protein